MWCGGYLGFASGWFACIVTSVLVLGVLVCFTCVFEWRFVRFGLVILVVVTCS